MGFQEGEVTPNDKIKLVGLDGFRPFNCGRLELGLGRFLQFRPDHSDFRRCIRRRDIRDSRLSGDLWHLFAHEGRHHVSNEDRREKGRRKHPSRCVSALDQKNKTGGSRAARFHVVENPATQLLKWGCSLGDRLVVGREILVLVGRVRILLPQQLRKSTRHRAYFERT